MFCWFSKCWCNCCSQVNHRRTCWWKSRSLPMSLVSWCCRCLHNSPPKLDGLLFISSLTRKHLRWKRGKLCAQDFFRSARLLRFSRGVQRPRRPIVDLWKSTLDGFCDGNKDFLKLSRSLSRFHSVDHSKNAQECLDCIHETRGTFGGTYGYENSGPHIDVLLDWSGTRALLLAWLFFEVTLLTTWCAQSLYGMSLKSTMWLALGQHYISLLTPKDFQSIFLVFHTTHHRRMSVYSLITLITKCMVIIPRSMVTASRCC